jgi:putative heme degradation protein
LKLTWARSFLLSSNTSRASLQAFGGFDAIGRKHHRQFWQSDQQLSFWSTLCLCDFWQSEWFPCCK